MPSHPLPSPFLFPLGIPTRDRIAVHVSDASLQVGCKKFGNDAKKCSFSFFLKTLFFISNLSRIRCLLIFSTLFPYYSANKRIREMLSSVCLLLSVLIENKGFPYGKFRIFHNVYEGKNVKITAHFLHLLIIDNLICRVNPADAYVSGNQSVFICRVNPT